MKTHFYVATLMLIAMPALANLYKCTKPDGTIYYQDKYCLDQSHIQTQLKCYNKPPDKTIVKELQKKLKDYRRHLSAQRKERLKKKLENKKQILAQKRQKIIRQDKCANIKLEIDKITMRRRTGYNVVQGIAMDRKLAEYAALKRKYCTNE